MKHNKYEHFKKKKCVRLYHVPNDFYARTSRAAVPTQHKRKNKKSHLKIIQAVMSQVHPERTVSERCSPFPETVQQPRDSWILPTGVQAQSPVRL